MNVMDLMADLALDKIAPKGHGRSFTVALDYERQ